MVTKELLELKPLTPNEVAAIYAFVEKIKELFGEKIISVILYGSKARGDAQFDSDIDLLVLMIADDYLMRRVILQSAAKVSLDFDLLLSVMAMSKESWLEREGLYIYTNIQKDGIIIKT